MKKLTLGVLGAGILLLLILSFGKNEKSEEIKIGVSLPLTGFAANYGDSSKAGIELALQDLKAKYPDLSLKMIYEDSLYSANGAISNYQKFRTVDDVKIVIVGGSQMGNAIKPLAAKDQVLEMAIWATVPSYSVPNDLNFRTSLLPSDFLPELISHLKKQKVAKLALLTVQNEFGVSYNEAFSQDAPKNGITIVSNESFLGDANDFRTQLSKMKTTKPDSIFYVGAVAQLVNVLKQAKELGITTPFLSTVSVEDSQLIKNARELAEGIVYAYPFDYEALEAKDFLVRYKNQYMEIPNQYAAEGYTSLMLIGEALNTCERKADVLCIKASLDSLKNYPTLMGISSFDEEGNLKTPTVLLKTVKNAEFVRLED